MEHNSNMEYLIKYRFGYYKKNIYDTQKSERSWDNWNAKWCETPGEIIDVKQEIMEEFIEKKQYWADFYQILICEIEPTVVESGRSE